MSEHLMKARDDWDHHNFVVEGHGEFPFDMLRHSSAWPADSESAAAMSGDVCSDKRRVMLTAMNARWVSEDRWASFGWRVVAGFRHGWPMHIDDYHGAMGRVPA